ncbi:MAG TPA: calcium-binding protein [Bauldia sp.]|nr:calcium-binding protein [Bauldia sp.]
MAVFTPTSSNEVINFDTDFSLLQLLNNKANYQSKTDSSFHVDSNDLFVSTVSVTGTFDHIPISSGTINTIGVSIFPSPSYQITGLNLDLNGLINALNQSTQDAQELIFAGIDTVYGTAFNDLLAGFGGADTLHGNAGNDKLYGGDGADTVFGGEGVDELYGGSNIDKLYGEANDDIMFAGTANDELYGGLGNDILFGEGDADKLFGEDGNDTLYGGSGLDEIDGGTGVDTLDYSAFASPVVTTLAGANFANVQVNGVLSDKVKNVENVIGGSGNDQLTGDASDNTFFGNGGADALSGGVGNDTLVGGANGDTIDGGDGVDTASYADKSVDVSVTLGGATAATVFLNGVAEDAVQNVENLVGGAGNDSFVGDAFANFFSGGSGNDSLSGGLGNDIVHGGDGDDTVQGGAGEDLLSGNAGADKFVFDVKAKAANADHILDFDALDTIVIDTNVFKSIKTDVFKAKYFHVGKKAKDASDYFIFNDKTDMLYFDKDGKGGKAQKLIATFETDVDVTSTDLLLI